MYIWKKEEKSLTELEQITFSVLKLKESDVEELIRNNLSVLCDDDESMLIIGQQVKNTGTGRSDLTAIDNNGDIVLIEIKRDMTDMQQRKEPMEFQAIRYAAGYATIKTTEELIQNIFAPYVEKHIDEFQEMNNLTSSEIAQRKLMEFMEGNNITAINSRQRIILVASEFDKQTLSAVAWLSKNNLDISCYQLLPCCTENLHFIDVKKILPPVSYEEFYVEVTSPEKFVAQSNGIKHQLPKIDKLLEWGVVKAGDIMVAKGKSEEAILLADGNVKTAEGDKKSLQQWLRVALGWSTVQTYTFTIDKKTGRTLADLRYEAMAQRGLE